MRIFKLTLILTLLVSSFAFSQKNEKVELVKVKINGNNYFATGDLEDVIISKESPNWFSQFLNSFSGFGSHAVFFDSLKIQDDISIIKNLYKSNGFFKTKVNAEYSIESNGEKVAEIIYNIQENTQSVIRKYELSGMDLIDTKLQADIGEFNSIDSSTHYSEQLIETNNKKTVSYLLDHGYILVDVSKPLVRIDTLENVVDVIINFDLGKRYRISQVRVKKSGPGENLVSDNLIKEIADVQTEEYYNTSKLKLSQIRLYRTNLFSSAVISGNLADTNNSYIPVDVITNVGHLYELSPELIAVNERNLFKFGLGLSFHRRNFLGDARKLNISTSFVSQNINEFLGQLSLNTNNVYGYADLRVGIEQPFLFGKPINTKLEGYYTLEKRKQQWNKNFFGANLKLNFELPPFTYITSLSTYTKWEYEKYFFNKDYLAKQGFIIDSLVTTEARVTNNVLGVNIIADKTNDLLFPTNGYAIALTAEDGNTLPYLFSLIGNYNFEAPNYYKILLTTTKFFPKVTFFDVVGLKLKLGNITAYRGLIEDIPFNQRFTAGGSNSLRGWKANKLPITKNNVTARLKDFARIERNITEGGFFLFEGSIEGRILLSDVIGTALFIDYGNVWDDYSLFRYDNIAVAAGFGFRYYSVFAPIRLDFGFKAYDPQDRRTFIERIKHSPFFSNFVIQIGIGEAF